VLSRKGVRSSARSTIGGDNDGPYAAAGLLEAIALSIIEAYDGERVIRESWALLSALNWEIQLDDQKIYFNEQKKFFNNKNYILMGKKLIN
jgi:hypothetical protein